jgi:hypothetical protein
MRTLLDTLFIDYLRAPPAPLMSMQKLHTAERLRKSTSRDAQGWQKRRPLTCRAATVARDGRIYERDHHGTVRKGNKLAT